MSSDISDRFVYFGLDIETTGSDSKSEIIQIGLYTKPYSTCRYVSDVGQRGNFYYEPKAFEVNGFTFDRIINGKPAMEVDIELEEFFLELSKICNVPVQNLIPVGFNVGSFDIGFVRRTFPKFSRLLNYRSIDLNAILAMRYKTKTEFDVAKTNAKLKCMSEITSFDGEHDALYDAELAYRVFWYLDEYICP